MAVFADLAGIAASGLFWPALVLLAVVLIAAQKYITYRRLAHFKGPFWAAWTEWWLAKVTWDSQIPFVLRDVNEKYGPVARIGPNLLVTSDADLLRKIGMARSTYSRAEWYDALKFDPRTHNTISEKDEKKHSELRYKLSHGYSGKDIPDRENRVDQRIMDFVNLIESKYISTPQELKVMDLARVSQYFTVDVLTDVAFGRPFGFLAADDDLYDYIKSLGPLMPLMELQSNITWLASFLNSKYVKKLLTPTANDGSGMGKMIGASQQAVAERYKPGVEQSEDMLGSFIKHGLTQAQAESESLLQVMAGSDSTATAVRVIMYLIMTNPLVYTKLRAELDDADRKGLLTWPVLTNAQALSLPYLQAVIKEGLRAYPPGVGISTKWVPPEGDTLEDGRFIPGGTRIGWSAWATQHNKEIYGDDAYYFRPERWLEREPGSKEQLRMERTHELIFGNGRYGCLGKSLAYIEMNKIFATFMRHFDMSVLDPTTPFKSRVNGFFVQSQMYVRVTKRDRPV